MALENIVTNTYRWVSKAEVFQNTDAFTLQADLNQLCEGRFVVGTQLFPDPLIKLWTAFVWYKLKV